MGEDEVEQTRVWKLDRHEVNFQRWDKTNEAVVAADAQLAAVFPVREGLGAIMLFARPLPTEEEAAQMAAAAEARARMEAMYGEGPSALEAIFGSVPAPASDAQLPLELRDPGDTLTEADFAELLKSVADEAQAEAKAEAAEDEGTLDQAA